MIAGPAPTTGAQAPAGDDARLDDEAFWLALRERGMTELLDYSLRNAGDARWADAQLLRRELQLARYADAARSNDEKLAALAEAIGILETLIAKRGADPRVGEWRLMLGKDLLYRQAEPYYMNILLKTPTPDDRRQLLLIATKAERVFTDLTTAAEAEKARIEALPSARFEKAIARLETVDDQKLFGAYFGVWARFYRALAMDVGNAEREPLLRGVLQFVDAEQEYTKRPHADTGVQCDSLVLAGMASRLLAEYDQAETFLAHAIEVAKGISEPDARAAVQWVEVLGRLETIRVARDQGDYETATSRIRAFRQWLLRSASTTLGSHLAITLLETSVYRQRAGEAKKAGDQAAAAKWLAASRKPLLELARSNPVYQDAVYETLYELMGPVVNVAELDPFEKNVYMAGLIREAAAIERRIATLNAGRNGGTEPLRRQEAQRLNRQMATKLDRAIRVADVLLSDKAALAAELRPETLFNRAVCLYQRGDLLAAVDGFIRVADEHATFKRAEMSAGHAVDIAASLYEDEMLQNQADVPETFLRALEVLTSRFPESDRAKYAQFFLASVLDRLGRHCEAATAYARVESAHPKYLDARYYRLLCLQRQLDAQAETERDKSDALRALATALLSEAKSFRASMEANPPTDAEDPAARALELAYYAGDAELVAATVSCTPALGDFVGALELLEGFAQRYPGHPDLLASALRVRILGHQGLRQFDEAARIVETFRAQDPANAGVVIGSLLAGLREDVARAHKAGDHEDAAKQAKGLLDLATQQWEWAQANGQNLSPSERLDIRATLADAHLLAGDVKKALALFSACVDEDAAAHDDGKARHGPSLFGKADALRRLGEFDQAVLLFNDVWHRTEERSTLWWRALAASLDCHLQLGTDPNKILDSIAQHRRMGSQAVKAEFDRIESQARQRQTTPG